MYAIKIDPDKALRNRIEQEFPSFTPELHSAIYSMSLGSPHQYCMDAADVLRSGTAERILSIIIWTNSTLKRDEKERRVRNTWHTIMHNEGSVTESEHEELLSVLRDPETFFLANRIIGHLRIQQSNENKYFIRDYLENISTERYTAAFVIPDAIRAVEEYRQIDS